MARIERKRKSEEARIAKEVEAHERIRKELEKQDMMRRKRGTNEERNGEARSRVQERRRKIIAREATRGREVSKRTKMLNGAEGEVFTEGIYEKDMQKEEAARLKAANDRAAAQRIAKIAKESLELIDDERLELMEIAALSKGLTSMMSLESLESLRGILDVDNTIFLRQVAP